jgi:hypothetical protein
MAEWLVNELNRPAPDPPPAAQIQNSTAHEYRVRLQEIVTLLRSVANIQPLFIYNNLKAMAVRGNGGQMARAEWLVKELNKPARERA